MAGLVERNVDKDAARVWRSFRDEVVRLKGEAFRQIHHEVRVNRPVGMVSLARIPSNADYITQVRVDAAWVRGGLHSGELNIGNDVDHTGKIDQFAVDALRA